MLRKLGRDGIAAIILILFSAWGVWETLSFPGRAAAWPLWMWGLLAFFSLILLVSSLRQSRNR